MLRGPAEAALAATCVVLPGALIVPGVSAFYVRWQALLLGISWASASLRPASDIPAVGDGGKEYVSLFDIEVR